MNGSMKMRLVLFVLSALSVFSISANFAPETIYARSVVSVLASPAFWGRGYTHDGMKKAADFIQNEFETIGALPLDGKNFLQPFQMAVNTFPKKMSVRINGKELVPGQDYIIFKESQGAKGTGELKAVDETHFVNSDQTVRVRWVDTKTAWSVGRKVSPYTEIIIFKDRFSEVPESYDVEIDNAFISDFTASNVAAIVKGTESPDSYIVMSAHYDHLGGMGDQTYFPGANDNAAGVATVLDLAKYYASHPQPVSMVFILFAAEEAGLVGSKYFSENSPIDLKKIRFLTNLDLVGTGEDGIAVVNGTGRPVEMKYLQDLNEQFKYFSKITPQDNRPNSDQYWFAQAGVPSFFIFEGGKPSFYHDIYDRSETLTLVKYSELLDMMIRFNESILAR